MHKPLISIAVCTYNGEKFLAEQLNSLVNQTYRNLEIVVTDDCSKDETIELLNGYAAKYDFIKIYKNEENLGYVKNFEIALSLCSGDYIALCDQDDIWDLNKITLQHESIGESLLNYHDSAFIDQMGQNLNKKLSDVVNPYQGDSFKPFLFFNCISGHATLIKRSLLEYALPFPKDLFHDRWLAYTATNLGTITYLDLPLVKYRQHENSDTNILKLDRKNVKKELHGVPKIKKSLAELRVMINFKWNKDQHFLEKLYHLYEGRLHSYFCLRLVIMMYANFDTLLFISKKSVISKLNFVFKHIWGSKFKSA
jgi:glycosyltransferase involved in cell wall biosynthesis